MSTHGSGCATATCANQAPGRRATPDESLRPLLVALAAALVLGAIGAGVLSIVPPRLGLRDSAVSAVVPPEQHVRRELLAELRRSILDQPRVVSLLEASGMSAEEGIGALRLARRAAAAGHDWEKARGLGEIIAQLEAGARTR